MASKEGTGDQQQFVEEIDYKEIEREEVNISPFAEGILHIFLFLNNANCIKNTLKSLTFNYLKGIKSLKGLKFLLNDITSYSKLGIDFILLFHEHVVLILQACVPIFKVNICFEKII